MQQTDLCLRIRQVPYLEQDYAVVAAPVQCTGCAAHSMVCCAVWGCCRAGVMCWEKGGSGGSC